MEKNQTYIIIGVVVAIILLVVIVLATRKEKKTTSTLSSGDMSKYATAVKSGDRMKSPSSQLLKTVPLTGYNNLVLSDQNGNLNSVQFPTGIIVIWSGLQTNIPNGWALCDGKTVNGVLTPDLRGRFVIGVNNDIPGTILNTGLQKHNMRDSGGSETIRIDQMPSHTHSYSDTAFLENSRLFNFGAWQNFGGNDQQRGNASSVDGDNSLIGMYAVTAPQGGGGKYFPPYYALAYIIKL